MISVEKLLQQCFDAVEVDFLRVEPFKFDIQHARVLFGLVSG